MFRRKTSLCLIMSLLLVLSLRLFREREEEYRCVGQWGRLGGGPGEFNEPFDIAVAPDGTLYVTDARNQRVQKFTQEGEFLREWGRSGKGPGEFGKPTGIAIDSHGNLYVSDYENDTIQKFTPEGRVLASWGTHGDGPGEFDAPSGVGLDSEGDIYVSDLYNHRVQKLTNDGQFLATWGRKEKVNSILSALNFLFDEDLEGGFYFPARIALSPQGEVFVSDSYNNRVQVFTREGRFLRKWGGMGIWGDDSGSRQILILTQRGMSLLPTFITIGSRSSHRKDGFSPGSGGREKARVSFRALPGWLLTGRGISMLWIGETTGSRNFPLLPVPDSG